MHPGTGGGGFVAIDAGLSQLYGIVREILARHRPYPVDLALLNTESRNERLADARLLIVGRRDTRQWPTRHCIREVRRYQPHLGIYLVVDKPTDLANVLKEHALVGTDQAYAVALSSDRTALAEDAWHRVAAPPPEVDLRIIATTLPVDARTVVMWILRNSDRFRRTSDLEEHFGRSSRSVARLLAKHGLPSFRELREVGLMLHAQEMRERGVKGEKIAAQLGLASGATLSRLLSRARRRMSAVLLSEGNVAAD